MTNKPEGKGFQEAHRYNAEKDSFNMNTEEVMVKTLLTLTKGE